MSDISSISGSQRLTSQLRVSLESMPTASSGQLASVETQELEQLKVDMAEIGRAFELISQIRQALEAALHDLTPNQ